MEDAGRARANEAACLGKVQRAITIQRDAVDPLERPLYAAPLRDHCNRKVIRGETLSELARHTAEATVGPPTEVLAREYTNGRFQNGTIFFQAIRNANHPIAPPARISESLTSIPGTVFGQSGYRRCDQRPQRRGRL